MYFRFIVQVPGEITFCFRQPGKTQRMLSAPYAKCSGSEALGDFWGQI